MSLISCSSFPMMQFQTTIHKNEYLIVKDTKYPPIITRVNNLLFHSGKSQQEDRAVRTLGVADGVMGCCFGGVVNTDYLEG
eukprot:scaffold542_cov202-Alexandrium_tamarense.AAC.14